MPPSPGLHTAVAAHQQSQSLAGCGASCRHLTVTQLPLAWAEAQLHQPLRELGVLGACFQLLEALALEQS